MREIISDPDLKFACMGVESTVDLGGGKLPPRRQCRGQL